MTADNILGRDTPPRLDKNQRNQIGIKVRGIVDADCVYMGDTSSKGAQAVRVQGNLATPDDHSDYRVTVNLRGRCPGCVLVPDAEKDTPRQVNALDLGNTDRGGNGDFAILPDTCRPRDQDQEVSS